MTERQLLIRHAYRLVGSLADAEDVVQEAYLRWHGQDRSQVDSPLAYLRTVVTRLGLDLLRRRRRERESYPGPWLPEPIVEIDPAEQLVQAEDLSFAFLLALEHLSPAERAAYLLHEVLEVPFEEIAATLERSSTAARQLASRARKKVRARPQPVGSPHSRALERLGEALRLGDVEGLRRVFCEDAVLLSDSGGKVVAARNVLRGPDRIARFLLGIASKNPQLLALARPARINGLPGSVIVLEGVLRQCLAFELSGESISAVYLTVNPDKLRGAEEASYTTGAILDVSGGR